MQRKRPKRWAIGLGIAGAILIMLVIGGLFGWQALMGYFYRQYYEQNYAPLTLVADSVGAHPGEFHLDNVPWIATEETLCQSNSLQMVAAQHGIAQPRRHFDFLMGFTYGFSEIPGGPALSPFTDPEPGFAAAAPYLGLVRRYYVTDDEQLYLAALRHYISQGYPVRVGLDFAALYQAEGQLPHSEVLIGYDAAGFYYYETVCIAPAPCQPGQRPAGERGLYVTERVLVAAVLGQARLFSYPWRYSFTVFEAGPLAQDLRPIWLRNGQSLVGGAQYGPRQGADVVDGLAERIASGGSGTDVVALRPGLEAAVFARRENATYLRETFAGQPGLDRVAALMDQAADDYQRVLDTMADGIADSAEALQASAWLHDAATAEREVGRLFLAYGQ